MRTDRRDAAPPLELVATGPEASGVHTRDTAVVVRDMFAAAERSVLVAGYAVHQGREVFEPLARRMAENPELKVRFFLDIARRDGDAAPAEQVVRQFALQFRARHWPAGVRLPDLHYDPRSCTLDAPVRSLLHSKCVVVDARQVFVSSANFTDAGQQRNIEIGIKVDSPSIARQLSEFFDGLVAADRLRQASWPAGP